MATPRVPEGAVLLGKSGRQAPYCILVGEPAFMDGRLASLALRALCGAVVPEWRMMRQATLPDRKLTGALCRACRDARDDALALRAAGVVEA